MDGRRTWPTWIFFFRISQVPPGRFVADCCGGWCWLLVLLAKLPGMSFFLWTISHHLGSFLLETWLYRIDAWLVNVCSQEWPRKSSTQQRFVCPEAWYLGSRWGWDDEISWSDPMRKLWAGIMKRYQIFLRDETIQIYGNFEGFPLNSDSMRVLGDYIFLEWKKTRYGMTNDLEWSDIFNGFGGGVIYMICYLNLDQAFWGMISAGQIIATTSPVGHTKWW